MAGKVNPISFRLPTFNLETPQGRSDAHRYVASGIVDLNQAIVALKSQQGTSTAMPTTTVQNITTIEQTTVFPFPGFGTVNDQTGNTTYQAMSSDNGALLIISDASPVAVTLNTAVATPWLVFAQNWGAGLVTFTPPAPALINSIGALGATAMTLATGYCTMIVWDGNNFYAETLPIVPVTFNAVAHEFLTAYDASTGIFSAAQPAFSDVSGNLATSQLPTAGLSVTITTAALTTLGTQGSQTFTGGLLTASTPAT